MLVTVDRRRCCASGNCALIAPEVFGQREEDGMVILLWERPAERLHELVREAADVCPTSAIDAVE
jgi:ferredoxin